MLGDLCNEVGWKGQSVVEKLETKRKERSSKFYERKNGVAKKRREILNSAGLKEARGRLATLGY